MWIKEYNGIYKTSLNYGVNFLYCKENIYVMDNHLCAAWCWIKELPNTKNNNLIHVDKHNDLLKREGNVVEALKQNKTFNLLNASFEEYVELSFTNQGTSYKVFSWDTYIMNLQVFLPEYFNKTFFSTFDNASTNLDFITNKLDFIDIINHLEYYINEDLQNDWILNVDIDYFFNNINDKIIQVFSNDYILEFATKVKELQSKIKVITFCLSPECCGGLENSLNVFNIFNDVLDLNFTLQK